MANLTAKQCHDAIKEMDWAIKHCPLDHLDWRLAYIENRLWWQERYGELIGQLPLPRYPGRKFHP